MYSNCYDCLVVIDRKLLIDHSPASCKYRKTPLRARFSKPVNSILPFSVNTVPARIFTFFIGPQRGKHSAGITGLSRGRIECLNRNSSFKCKRQFPASCTANIHGTNGISADLLHSSCRTEISGVSHITRISRPISP